MTAKQFLLERGYSNTKNNIELSLNELEYLLIEFSKPDKDELKELKKMLDDPDQIGEYLAGF